MNRARTLAIAASSLSAAVAICVVTGAGRLNPGAIRSAPVGMAAGNGIVSEPWSICTSMGWMAIPTDWAELDPEFAAGLKALAANDWPRAIATLTPVALRDSRNADVQNYLGYAYRRLRHLDLAFSHFRRALMLNPRHRGAHGHIGEAYLAIGETAGAEEHLATLASICLIPCEEYDNLKGTIAAYKVWTAH